MPFTYAIADLHGRYDLLSEAVTRIVEHSKSDRPATVITLGDYVDRGPKSCQVIERLIAEVLLRYDVHVDDVTIILSVGDQRGPATIIHPPSGLDRLTAALPHDVFVVADRRSDKPRYTSLVLPAGW
jgi:hypothetical protein